MSSYYQPLYDNFYNFNDGKGFATILGMMVSIKLVFIQTWLITLLIKCYSTVAVIIEFLKAPFYVCLNLIDHTR